MQDTSSKLRKAAVLLRSVDAETAATLLSQLSIEEASALRQAIRTLGSIDPGEQAEVLAAFRRERPPTADRATAGVELSLSSSASVADRVAMTDKPYGKRFEFLEAASAQTVASYLAREHAQTIAVVLSHLTPARAAAILAAMSEKTQLETMERLAALGDTDSEVVTVLERELSEWIKKRGGDAGGRGRMRDAASSILAAADSKTRDAIVANLKARNAPCARQLGSISPSRTGREDNPFIDEYRVVRSMARRSDVNGQLRVLASTSAPAAASFPRSTTARPALPRIDFDHLIHLDSRTLAQLLAAADPTMLALALSGSQDELVERVCDQLPKRVAKTFRRELRRMGPTRLSDVEAAQRAIAELAAQQLAGRRSHISAAAG